MADEQGQDKIFILGAFHQNPVAWVYAHFAEPRHTVGDP